VIHSQDYLSAGVADQYYGSPAIVLESAPGKSPSKPGDLGRRIPAEAYRDRRVRLEAWVRSEAVREGAGIYLAFENAQGGVTAVEGYRDKPRLKGTGDWTYFSLRRPVPVDAAFIHAGIWLDGRGKLWAARMQLSPEPLRGKEQPIAVDAFD
jgi:hypothetical protein